MQDQLFSPTIRDGPPPGRPPWRPESIVYPAFFGGPLAAATLGVLNGRRLGLPSGQLLAIAAAGLVGAGARLALSAAIDGTAVVRLGGLTAGTLVWLLVLAAQRKPFRAFTYRGGKPSSLVGPGFLAFFGCGFLEGALIFWMVR